MHRIRCRFARMMHSRRRADDGRRTVKGRGLFTERTSLSYDLAVGGDRSTGDWFRSALPMLLLCRLADEPQHGYALMEGLRSWGFDVKGATVYPHLNRLHDEGRIDSEWHAPRSGPARKIMTITDEGREHLRELQEQWALFRSQMDAALERPAHGSAADGEED
ncbi:PadR family transcriptional regulator [Microbacterium lushaniae]|uniref:PadR family transcriptional regulator n=1 Tax=Microbacterium lushaniae TaxID=2614639 RepID=A0A5J6KZZ3_9MICO|nr:PadR family transcriptional regulator [Microbacterium lushaniae]